jgi:hypothetical protein
MEFLRIEFVIGTLPTSYGFAPVLESLRSSLTENLQRPKCFGATADLSSIDLRYELFINILSSTPTRRAVKYRLAQLLLQPRKTPRTTPAAKTSKHPRGAISS